MVRKEDTFLHAFNAEEILVKLWKLCELCEYTFLKNIKTINNKDISPKLSVVV